jgi:hypothetical protein
MKQTTSVSFQINPNHKGGYFDTHNGTGTAYGPVRWTAEISACKGKFTAASDSPCRANSNDLKLEWARSDLAAQYPNRCILEAGKTYYMNVRVSTPQPNTYCTNSSGIEMSAGDIYCGGPNPVGVCPMIPDGKSL